jgi:hypothetical protein
MITIFSLKGVTIMYALRFKNALISIKLETIVKNMSTASKLFLLPIGVF